MNLVESKYQESMSSLTPLQRVARAVGMFQWSRDIIARQIIADLGPINSERLKWMIALRQYGTDKTTKEMILKALQNVPR
jgi:hypothetical protein